jgi:hypothetical protein
MMPPVYLKAVVKLFRNLSEVPIILPELVDRLHNEMWRNMSDIERCEQLFKVRGVPVPYIRDDSMPNAGAKVTQAYELVLQDIKKFTSKPMTLYLHSGFEASALKAASSIIKESLKAGIEARMVGLGALLKEIKTWDEKNESVALVEKAQVLCLYLVGKEYTTEFTQSELQGILDKRFAEGKTTLISTHLEPEEFQKRYGFTPRAVVMKFEDAKITSTVDDLLAYMRKG